MRNLLFLTLWSHVAALDVGRRNPTPVNSPAEEITRHVQPSTSSKCSQLDGVSLYNKFNENPYAWKQVCTGSGTDSWLKCSFQGDIRSDLGTDYLCQGQNLRLYIPSDQELTVGDALVQQADVFISACKGEKQLRLEDFYENTMHLKISADMEQECRPDSTLAGKFIVMHAIDNNNPYEGFHQPLMAFASMAALGMDLQGTRIAYVKVDPRTTQVVNFREHIFSSGGPPVHLAAGPVCLQSIIFPISGAQAFTAMNKGFDDPIAQECHSSPVLLGFVDHIKSAYGLVPRATTSRRFRIVMDSRTHGSRRVMVNEGELISKLKGALEPASLSISQDGTTQLLPLPVSFMRSEKSIANSKASSVSEFSHQVAKKLRSMHADWQVEVVSPSELSAEEQVKLFSDTDLLIGPHGASLTWSLFLRQCGQVVEFCTGSEFHYVNLAHYVGKPHSCLQGPSGWGASSFQANVNETLKKVTDIYSQWTACIKQD